MKLESIAKIAIWGFGDQVFTGFLMGLLDAVSPEQFYQAIKNDYKIVGLVPEDTWVKLRQWGQNAKLGNLTKESFMEALGRYHMNLLGIVLNTPNGEAWLEKQLQALKGKLGVDMN